MEAVTQTAHKATLGVVPQWNREMPTGSPAIKACPVDPTHPLRVVYFPSCASRAMGGPAREETQRLPLPQQTLSLLQKGGYAVILPEHAVIFRITR